MSAETAELVDRARDGEPRSVARLISMVENASPALREVMATLTPYAGNAMVIGLTGSPGVGKSTTTSGLLTAYRSQDKRVGVLAVDPSSPFSGGALLGDRVRMQEHATDPGVYIRSMGSRGHLGGLSWATPQAVRVLDAAGCDVVIVETVGVGQAEVEIASTPRSCCWRPVWATASRRPRPGSSRSPTCTSSTKPTVMVRTTRSATCGT
jgi:LAO/AO transport system kinase